MNRKIRFAAVLLTVLAIVFSLCVCSFAAGGRNGRLVDEADLIKSDVAEENLRQKLDSLSEELEFDIAVLTVNDMSGYSFYGYSYDDGEIQDFADDYYDANDYGYGSGSDGVIFVICMSDRSYYISTCGYGIEAITDAGRMKLEEQIVPYLSSGNYYDAFDKFADTVASYVTDARSGNIYDPYTDYYDYGDDYYYEDEPVYDTRTSGEKFTDSVGRNGIIGAIIGLIVSAISTHSMKNKLTSVKAKANASEYAVRDSLALFNNQEVYLYNTVTAVPKPKDPPPSKTGGGGGGSHGGSMTHVSHSGGSHGGGGGHF